MKRLWFAFVVCWQLLVDNLIDSVLVDTLPTGEVVAKVQQLVLVLA